MAEGPLAHQLVEELAGKSFGVSQVHSKMFETCKHYSSAQYLPQKSDPLQLVHSSFVHRCFGRRSASRKTFLDLLDSNLKMIAGIVVGLVGEVQEKLASLTLSAHGWQCREHCRFVPTSSSSVSGQMLVEVCCLYCS